VKFLSAGITALVFGLLMFVPAIVLGAAIDWPASLDEPASVVMPLIVEQAVAVQIGYVVYLAYSILFLPVVALLGRVAGDSLLVRVAIVLAGISALARSIGILRWLTVLPELAANNGSPELFDAINSFGGGIGELLGVSIFGAGAVALIAIALRTALPRWITVTGLIAAAGLLLPWFEVFGLDLGAIISVSVAGLQFWFIALGVTLLVKAKGAK
jgi:hypothetical protein